MPPTVFPTGVTIYEPERCWNGYTIFQPRQLGATLIDMNGNVVNRWRGLQGLPGPNKLLPGGYVMGSTGQRDTKLGFQDNLDLVQVDWDGRTVWRPASPGFFRLSVVDAEGRKAAAKVQVRAP